MVLSFALGLSNLPRESGVCKIHIIIRIASCPIRTNIELDDALVEEAFRLTNVRTKKDLLNLALQELIHSRKKKNLLDLAGKVQLRDDYDYKALRSTRHAVD